MRYCIFLLSVCCFGQQNDLSFWTKNTTQYPWYIYSGKKIVVDARYNFDAPDTGGVCLGKSYGKESLTLIPEVCGYVGGTNGFGPELLILSANGKYFVFSQNQYVFGVGNNSFVYHWLDLQREVTKKISLGFGEQVFKELSSLPGQMDIGPSSKLTFGKVYFRFWPAWSVGPSNYGARTIYAGIGYVF